MNLSSTSSGRCQNTGIIDRLEEMGIQENDTVDIDGFEFDYLR